MRPFSPTPHSGRIFKEIEISDEDNAALFLGAESMSVQEPNWPRTFARRGVRYADYDLVDVILVAPAGIAPAKRIFIFEPDVSGSPLELEWPLGLTGSLQGDVIVSSRAELHIPVLLLHSFLVPVTIPEELEGAGDEPIYSASFAEIEDLLVASNNPQARAALDVLRTEWQPASFACLCKDSRDTRRAQHA